MTRTFRRPVVRGIFALGAVLLGLAGSVAPAAAAPTHGGAGQISVVEVRAIDPDTVSLEVCVAFTLDREQADTARVTMRGQGPGDAQVDAVPMEVGDQPGLRVGELTFPRDGSWTIVVESTFPPAQLTVPLTVGGDRSLPAGSPPGSANAAPAATCQAATGGAQSPWLVAGLGTAAGVMVFGGLLLLLRRAAAPNV